MRRAVVTWVIAAAMLAVLSTMLVPAQEPPRPRVAFGKVGNDPTGCAETPEAVRRLYAECTRTNRGPVQGAQRTEPACRRVPPSGEEPTRRAALEAAGCRDMLVRIQLREEPSDADLAHLRSQCHGRE
jgi:hypothetical protein